MRPYNFDNKRVFVLTSRVHPGETPASFVFNGFLEFILNKDDPRAKMLRKHFVFKLIPLLNPDGVSRGHYRTDQLGMNLNRVYLDPNFSVHPAIYAAKSLVVYHHIMNRVGKEVDGLRFDGIFDLQYDCVEEKQINTENDAMQTNVMLDDSKEDKEESIIESIENLLGQEFIEENRVLTPGSLMLSARSRQLYRTELDEIIDKKLENLNRKFENLNLEVLQDTNQENSYRHRSNSNTDLRSNRTNRSNRILLTPIKKSSQNTPRNGDIENEIEQLKQNIAANIYTLRRSHDYEDVRKSLNNSEPYIGNENSDEDDDVNFMNSKQPNSPHLNDSRLLLINPLNSGIGFYVDLHGHAAKRGCFIYGNAIENEEHQIDNVLYAKLISLNSQHFDFDGCNFSLKNMYYKDKREGLSKEGSGRVALFKAIGLIHSYTLECNYACGRVMNTVAPASNSSLYNGRISPPQHTDIPPKFLPEHYQNVGKGLAIAVLDFTETNPCTRVNNTTFGSLDAVRNWVKFYIRTKSNSNKKFSISQTKVQNKSNPQNVQTSNGEYKGGRRNTAPTSNLKANEMSRKNFFTQLSQPNNTRAAATISKEGNKSTGDLKYTKNSNNYKATTSQISNLINTPVTESKNFIRKQPTSTTPVATLSMETKKTKLVNELIASNSNNINNEEEDFRAFNNFIHKIDANEDDEREELITMEEIDEVLNGFTGTKLATHETNWFLNDNSENSNNNNNGTPSAEKGLNSSKPNSKLSRFQNISKSSFGSPVRELLPMNKATVSHSNMSEVEMNVLTRNQINFMSNDNKAALNILGISNVSVMGNKQQNISKNSNNSSIMQNKQQLASKQKSKTQIKAIYSTNLIKKFLNTNKMQITSKHDIKAIASLNNMQQQEKEQQDGQAQNNIENNSKKKAYLTEYKHKLSYKKTLQQNETKNSVVSESVVLDNKKLKRKRMKENAKKVIIILANPTRNSDTSSFFKLKVNLPNIEKYETPVKINQFEDVTAFWIDL